MGQADGGGAADGGGRLAGTEAAAAGGLLEPPFDLCMVEEAAADIAEQPQPGPVQGAVALAAAGRGGGDPLTLTIQSRDGIRVAAASGWPIISRAAPLDRGRLQQPPQPLGDRS
jgi:hypothetical protein